MNGPLCELEIRLTLLREDLCVATKYGGRIPYSDITVERIKSDIEEQPALPAQARPPGPVAQLQFRLVAVASDASAADELPDPADRTGDRKLRLCREVLLDNSHVQIATAVTNATTGRAEIVVHFTTAGAERFRQITRTNLQRQLAIVFNGRVLSAPIIQVEIDSGQCKIVGGFSPSEAARMAAALTKHGL